MRAGERASLCKLAASQRASEQAEGGRAGRRPSGCEQFDTASAPVQGVLRVDQGGRKNEPEVPSAHARVAARLRVVSRL